MARPQKISNEDILSAARQVFLEQGVGASTVTIAERAGISEASIFKRFTTKQALFLAAMGVTIEPSWAKLLATQTPTAEVKAELTELCENMLKYYQEVLPRMLMLMSQGKLPGPREIVVPPQIRHRRLLARFLGQAMAQGYLRPGNPETTASMIVGTLLNSVINQTMMSRLSAELRGAHQTTADPAQLVHELIDTLWTGINPD
ncbi:MAG: TetR/AcrR family transcriptional regulator [Cyanobacteria bacterium P01_H01_bin.26]